MPRPEVECSWQCYCGSIIDFIGDYGTEVSCRACKQVAVVTPDGAQAVVRTNGHKEKPHGSFVIPYDGPTYKESHGADG